MKTLRTLILAFALVAVSAPAEGQVAKGDPNVPAPAEMPQVVKAALQGKTSPRLADWSLLIDERDQVRGNAALVWLRAGSEARNVKHKWTNAEYAWSSIDETPLAKLPRKEVKALLDKHATALSLADVAARRSHCDWEQPALTIQSLGTLLPLDTIQMHRHLMQLLKLRCRLELAEKRFGDARETIRTCLSMTRHVGNSELLIQDLVGIALGAITLGCIDEWIGVEGSPDLYWPLTELPRPFLGVTRSVRYELQTMHRSFPQLKDFREKKLSEAQARALFDDMLGIICKVADKEVPAWKTMLTSAAMVATHHAAAKKALVERGLDAKDVEAMPAAQAVALYMADDFDRLRDEFVKWTSVPAREGYPKLQALAEAERKRAKDAVNPLASMLLPALDKTLAAGLRSQWQFETVRAAEAVRHHRRVKGSYPATWADLCVPAPTDPITGKGLGAGYAVNGGKPVFVVPAPLNMGARLGRRYEFE